MCRSCALRAQKSFVFGSQLLQRRAFTASSSQQKRAGPPVFDETSTPALDNVLATLRDKHLIPAYLNDRQRHLVFGDKFKTELDNNPAYATLGDEEVQLRHMNRRVDIPALSPLIAKALSLMQDSQDWKQSPALLEGLRKGGHVRTRHAEKLVRKAIQADQLGVVIRCLNRSAATGLTLKHDNILSLVMWGLHEHAQKDSWDEARVRKAQRYGDMIAELLESDDHGSARRLGANDPRTRPAVIAVYLEISAVLAERYQGGKDVDGSVLKYATRLMANFNQKSEPAEEPLPKAGLQTEFLAKLPIWHGLSLAKKILGDSLPQASSAAQIISTYEARLVTLAAQLREQNKTKPGFYAAQALEAWESALRN
ncbi:hypothetical protein AAFC00_003225 [Neodothiora populina]|uniref:Uncharacterized protein n=1 Tax=Neodothiora populina TaxID=2781224 RepID=A0ABR3P9Z8_9PEZI